MTAALMKWFWDRYADPADGCRVDRFDATYPVAIASHIDGDHCCSRSQGRALRVPGLADCDAIVAFVLQEARTLAPKGGHTA